jgi:hypothetical protein
VEAERNDDRKERASSNHIHSNAQEIYNFAGAGGLRIHRFAEAWATSWKSSNLLILSKPNGRGPIL